MCKIIVGMLLTDVGVLLTDLMSENINTDLELYSDYYPPCIGKEVVLENGEIKIEEIERVKKIVKKELSAQGYGFVPRIYLIYEEQRRV